jgi:hypothetical protein
MTRWLIACFVFVLVIISCRKHSLYTDRSAALTFSTDTIQFDTVFSRFDTNYAPLSTTKILKIFNPYKSAVETDIELAGGDASVFRINVDGIPSSKVTGYKLGPGDSMYLFVQVTPRIATQSNPLFVEDSILFTTNGNTQKVHLVAWGQDAHYLMDSVIDYDTVWNDKSKPYVIWSSVLVAPNRTLRIDRGVKVCNHIGSRIYIQGTLEIMGVQQEPVVLQGDRLERNLDDVPSQWWGIRLLPGSKNNIINNAIIKNGVAGIEIDSLPVNANPNVVVNSTVIRTMSSGCIIGYAARAEFTNCVFIDAGQLPVYGQFGGNYGFTFCTIANPHCISFQSNYPAFFMGNADYPVYDAGGNVIQKIPSNLKLRLYNNIIYGESTNEEEFSISDGGGSGTIDPISISNCLIRTKNTSLNVNNNIINSLPRFKDQCKFNYQIDSISPALHKGIPKNSVNFDILSKPRDPSHPSIGAYEGN